MSLEKEITAAVRDGLTGLTLWRVGTSTVQWQASSRWRGHDAFCIAIEPDPVSAITKALTESSIARGKAIAAPAPAPAKPAAPSKPAALDWDDDEPAPSPADEW